MNSETKQGVRNNKENKMYEVNYANHDSGNQYSTGKLIRATLTEATRTAKLLKECGYREVKVVAHE
jgi:hypothetical protein